METYTSSAFSSQKNQGNYLVYVPPPVVHTTPYMTGGLHHLYQKTKTSHLEATLKQVLDAGSSRNSEQPDHGTYTNKDGCFCPVADMVPLAGRYHYVDTIGKGQSSVVIKAKDTFRGGELVSIKVLHSECSMVGVQEIDCLRRLNKADPFGVSCTLKLYTAFTFESHCCLVFELLHPTPLLEIFSSISRQPAALQQVRKVALHLLLALGFLQQENVLHADLKPDNLLLKHAGDMSSLKVVDFGNALHCVYDELSLYYDDFEVQTPRYRAPEVVFGIPFSMEIDVWSVGCILAELYTGRPLFPSKSKRTHIQKMSMVLGPVPQELFQRGKFFQGLSQYTVSNPPPHDVHTSLLAALGCQDHSFADFLAGLLKYNPVERLTVSQAAMHPFLAAELPLRFLMPPQTNGCQKGYPQVLLQRETYTKRPHIDVDIATQHLSSIDLLRRGSRVCAPLPPLTVEVKGTTRKVAQVIPLKRETPSPTTMVDTQQHGDWSSSRVTSDSVDQNARISVNTHGVHSGSSGDTHVVQRDISRDTHGVHRDSSMDTHVVQRDISRDTHGVHRDSSMDTHGVLRDISRDTHGVHRDSSMDIHDIHRESSMDTHGVHRDISRDTHGEHRDISRDTHVVHRDSSRDTHGVHRDISRDTHGVHRDSLADTHGVHGDSSRDTHGRDSSADMHGVHRDISRDTHGVHRDSSMDTHGVHRDISRDTHGVHRDISRDTHVVHRDSSRDTHGRDSSADMYGVHRDISRDTHGVHRHSSGDTQGVHSSRDTPGVHIDSRSIQFGVHIDRSENAHDLLDDGCRDTRRVVHSDHSRDIHHRHGVQLEISARDMHQRQGVHSESVHSGDTHQRSPHQLETTSSPRSIHKTAAHLGGNSEQQKLQDIVKLIREEQMKIEQEEETQMSDSSLSDYPRWSPINFPKPATAKPSPFSPIILPVFVKQESCEEVSGRASIQATSSSSARQKGAKRKKTATAQEGLAKHGGRQKHLKQSEVSDLHEKTTGSGKPVERHVHIAQNILTADRDCDRNSASDDLSSLQVVQQSGWPMVKSENMDHMDDDDGGMDTTAGDATFWYTLSNKSDKLNTMRTNKHCARTSTRSPSRSPVRRLSSAVLLHGHKIRRKLNRGSASQLSTHRQRISESTDHSSDNSITSENECEADNVMISPIGRTFDADLDGTYSIQSSVGPVARENAGVVPITRRTLSGTTRKMSTGSGYKVKKECDEASSCETSSIVGHPPSDPTRKARTGSGQKRNHTDLYAFHSNTDEGDSNFVTHTQKSVSCLSMQGDRGRLSARTHSPHGTDHGQRSISPRLRLDSQESAHTHRKTVKTQFPKRKQKKLGDHSTEPFRKETKTKRNQSPMLIEDSEQGRNEGTLSQRKEPRERKCRQSPRVEALTREINRKTDPPMAVGSCSRQFKSRTPENTKSRTPDHTKSRTGDHTKSRTGDHTKSRTGDHTKSRTPDHTKSRTPDHTKSRTGDHTKSRNPDHTKSRTPDHTKSRTPDHAKSRTPEHSKSRTPEQNPLTTGYRSNVWPMDFIKPVKRSSSSEEKLPANRKRSSPTKVPRVSDFLKWQKDVNSEGVTTSSDDDEAVESDHSDFVSPTMGIRGNDLEKVARGRKRAKYDNSPKHGAYDIPSDFTSWPSSSGIYGNRHEGSEEKGRCTKRGKYGTPPTKRPKYDTPTKRAMHGTPPRLAAVHCSTSQKYEQAFPDTGTGILQGLSPCNRRPHIASSAKERTFSSGSGSNDSSAVDDDVLLL